MKRLFTKAGLFYTFILAGILLLHGCITKTPHVPINADLKAAFKFKPGSYWIYKDSATGMLDSFYVWSYSDVYNDEQNINTATETVNIGVVEKNVYPGTLDSELWDYILSENIIGLIYNNGTTFYPLINYPFSFAIIPSASYSSVPDSTAVTAINNSYTISGQNFSNVAVVYAHGDLFSGWLYICPDIGYIKIVLNQPQDSLYRVWELQRWHIVK